MEISEKEFAVIRAIDGDDRPDQRAIASRTGMSLGMTNLIIKRLIKKGYVKARQLNRKKIEYLLTPRGFSEKASKSYNYAVKTISLMRSLRERLQDLLAFQYKQGVREYILNGDNDELVHMIEMALKNEAFAGSSISNDKSGAREGDNALTLVCRKEGKVAASVDIIAYLTGTGIFWQ